VEHRDIFCGTSAISQGSLQLWIEVFPASGTEAARFPYFDITRPKKEKFELRVIVWDAQEMLAADTLGDMNDLYFAGHFTYRDSQNVRQEVVQHTDIHWRAKRGKGSFNYRLVFKEIELPIDDDGTGSDDLPTFTLKAWDQDVIGASDQIGSTSRNLSELFNRGYSALMRMKARDDEIQAMTTEQLLREIAQITTAKADASVHTSGQRGAENGNGKGAKINGEDDSDSDSDSDSGKSSVEADIGNSPETKAVTLKMKPLPRVALEQRSALIQRLMDIDPVRCVFNMMLEQTSL
jgi:hypothetical protein